jgi:protein involved in polysaccharide export with SLBB domain
MLAASACSEGSLPEVDNEPPEVAQLRAAGKTPREIRDELRARELKKTLKGAAASARRAH